MAKFGLLLPRMEMVEPAGRIARELGMGVVVNQSNNTEEGLEGVGVGRGAGGGPWGAASRWEQTRRGGKRERQTGRRCCPG